MKVLFAVSSESISDAIIRRYQKEYKEILSYKNVYYFNAILKEIQKDKTYDRIVISEDLEPFSNNNYDTIDKFIFEKLDNISDEAQDSEGKETSIILICTERHTKGSSFLVKLFGIGVYNALLGTDRSMENVCKLINKPRVKKEAKIYYKIDSDDVSYDPKSEQEVSELEIQNILTYFKKISKNKEKYADIFNNIASQYTDDQLKIIINCLPIGVKAVLEEECPRYQELMSASGMKIQKVSKTTIQDQEAKAKTGIKIDILENKMTQAKMSGPIVIPSSVKTAKNKGPIATRPMGNAIQTPVQQSANQTQSLGNKKIIRKSGQETVQQQVQPKMQRPSVTSQKVQPQNTQKVQNVQKNDEDDILFGIEQIEEIKPATPQKSFEKEETKIEKTIVEENNDSLGLDFEEDFVPEIDTGLEDFDLDLNTENQEEEFIPSMVDDSEDDLDLSLGLETEESEQEDFLPTFEDDTIEETTENIKKGRGRPRKNPVQEIEKPKGKRGRPRKVEETFEEDDDSLVLDFNFEDETEEFENEYSPNIVDDSEDELDLGLETEEYEEFVPSMVDDSEDELDLGLETEEYEEEFVPSMVDDSEDELDLGLETEEYEEEFVPSMVDDSEDELDLGLEAEEYEEEFVPSMVDDSEDELDLGLETEEYEEEFVPSMVDDSEDELDLGLETEEYEEVIPEIVDNSENELISNIDDEYEEVEEISTEEYSEEMSVPGIDELDDLEIYEEDDSMLPNVDYEEVGDDDYLLSDFGNQVEEQQEESLLIDLEDDNDDMLLNGSNISQTPQRPEMHKTNQSVNQNNYYQNSQQQTQIESIKPQVDYSMSSLNSLLTKDKKIVTFIGTTKNGTSFLINNLAALFSSLGINTAILDMTKNRNSYYIYTKNEEELRKIAYTSIEKLQDGYSEGIKVDKNLTVYTALPNDGKDYSNAETILSTLVQNHSLILIDCDFDTDPSYFASCQEIYLVQSMDILTIQPLTFFLRDLKAQGVLESEKVRVVINKEIAVRSLSTKVIIGGMSFYNDPAMSFMTELFNKDMVKACSIPFEDSVYSKYLDAMVNCNVTINGYSSAFQKKLRILGDMVYPLTSKQTYSKPTQSYGKNSFSNSINNTLNQMKNKY